MLAFSDAVIILIKFCQKPDANVWFQVTEIARLSIIVGLPEDHYPSEEQMFFALAQVMQSMRKFKLFCSEKSKFGQKIKWRWAKTGDLESLANLAPLQGLVDMSDEEV